jgi:hypothetical protein
MDAYCLIADQIVRIADGCCDRLLFDFLVNFEKDPPASAVACTVYAPESTHIHGVHAVQPAHPVSKIFTFDLDPFGYLAADEDYSHITVFNRKAERLTETMLTGVYSALISRRTLFAHGALIDVPDLGGIMFIGNAGVGKTTQAVLWNRYRGAEIINGDKVFLGLRDDAPGQVLAYGSPWRGSSPYCVNKRVPLRAIVSLVRRPTPYVRRLHELEIMGVYMPRIFLPGWDDQLTETVMETMDAMLPLVPVFEMSCTPDESAVILLERFLSDQL